MGLWEEENAGEGGCLAMLFTSEQITVSGSESKVSCAAHG